MPPRISIAIGEQVFRADLRFEVAPLFCAEFLAMLPLRRTLIHARWSGEACWIPFGENWPGLPIESPMNAPPPGQLLYYPGGISEAEILLPYGTARFACKAGALAGTPFLKIVEDLQRLTKVCERVLWDGAHEICFRSSY